MSSPPVARTLHPPHSGQASNLSNTSTGFAQSTHHPLPGMMRISRRALSRMPLRADASKQNLIASGSTPPKAPISRCTTRTREKLCFWLSISINSTRLAVNAISCMSRFPGVMANTDKVGGKERHCFGVFSLRNFALGIVSTAHGVRQLPRGGAGATSR